MRNPRCRRRRGAFTLVEVLLVLVILVILASLAVTAYGPIQRRANIDAAKTQIGAFKTPLQVYQLHLNSYPTTAQGLEGLRTEPTDAMQGKWDGPYLEDPVPLDPWGNPYQYECPGSRNPESYDAWSWGPDLVDGTEDDIGNWQTE